MSRTVNQAGKKGKVAEVEWAGEKMLLPNGWSIPDAIRFLTQRQEYLEHEVVIRSEVNVFPWDGANALNEVLSAKYGWVQGVPTPGFFGDTPPQLIRIQVGPHEYKEIPWGRLVLPSIDGYINTGFTITRGVICFEMQAAVKRKDEAEIRDLFERVRRFVKEGSIYQGKAIKIRFKSDDGERLDMPEPEFMDVSDIDKKNLILSRDIEAEVEDYLFTPIERARELNANGMSVKRGVLLGGPYGTGKTLAAYVAGKIATQNDITFVYVPRADELPHAVNFARQYQTPASVIFCEDIDRVMKGERDVKMDDILNIIDGIDSKRNNIQIILTTNHMDDINPVMLRPGRLDATIEINPPDAEAVQRLLRFYGEDAIEEDTDLAEVGEVLEGAIPAVVEEVVKRAKLSELRLTPMGHLVENLSQEALLVSAKSIAKQRERLEKKAVLPTEPTFNDVMAGAVQHAFNGKDGGDFRRILINDVAHRVREVF